MTTITSRPLTLADLSPRDRRICELVFQGMSNREIGDIVCLEEQSVKSRRSHLYRATGTRNRTTLAVWYFHHLPPARAEQPR